MYKITTNGSLSSTHFQVQNYDDAMNLVSMLAEYGKVEKNEYDKDFKIVKSTIVPMSVTLEKVFEEVGLNE